VAPGDGHEGGHQPPEPGGEGGEAGMGSDDDDQASVEIEMVETGTAMPLEEVGHISDVRCHVFEGRAGVWCRWGSGCMAYMIVYILHI
jgi:hypothetical protein